MKKKTMKAIRDLNAYIDNDRQKLCDELQEIKLSHKRMERLLKMTLKFIDRSYPYFMFPSIQGHEARYLKDRIKSELSYPCFRANWFNKQKGGKKCV